MISGIGVDIVELERISEIVSSQPKFIERVLTNAEIKQFERLSSKRRIEYLAGRFAAKEAFAKAAGTGIGKDLSFLDIEVAVDEKGKPFFIKPFQTNAHLSISHSRQYAVAQVVLEKIL
ncbi:holo-ACP synthase [Bacillus sp. V3-13]|uniref:holo-ACP synthase n=1 Tax=Bacillus sp. V3-13 TaxID=2053728 RepID=UPI000C792306|nr:holo-ACP synthase [Bacillus sp. V3-13]PLR77297.1 holo-ACP synthase [Bacillus sp. V3-13]